jgi:Flp pilus assembly pilin Flp
MVNRAQQSSERTLRRRLVRCVRNDSGQGTVEYVMLVGLISVPLAMLLLYILRRLFGLALTRMVQEFTGY